MSEIYHFESVQVWQKARILNNRIYFYISKGFLKETHLKTQLYLLSEMLMDEIAVAFDCETNPDIGLIMESRNECSQLQSCLYRMLDCKHISAKLFRLLYDLIAEIKKMLNEFILNYQQDSFLSQSFFESN